MYRGTTPTFIFTLPPNIECGSIDKLDVCFAQQDEVIVEKRLCDCVVQDNKITVTLTEEETLKFDCTRGFVYIQLRIGIGESRLASNIIQTTVGKILKDGCLTGD